MKWDEYVYVVAGKVFDKLILWHPGCRFMVMYVDLLCEFSDEIIAVFSHKLMPTVVRSTFLSECCLLLETQNNEFVISVYAYAFTASHVLIYMLYLKPKLSINMDTRCTHMVVLLLLLEHTPRIAAGSFMKLYCVHKTV